MKYNQEHTIMSVRFHKAMRDLTDQMTPAAVSELRGEYKTGRHKDMTSRAELQKVIAEMGREMKEVPRNLAFERAAALRDEMYELKSLLAQDESLKPWERIKLLTGEGE
jgi:excinuclease ABC subunit B